MSSHHCHEGHEKHLCQIKDDFDKLKKLVKDPLFICKNCGRAAKNEENLCKPTKLEPGGTQSGSNKPSRVLQPRRFLLAMGDWSNGAASLPAGLAPCHRLFTSLPHDCNIAQL